MTLCIHVATKNALIVCSDGRTESFIRKDDGSDEIINIDYNNVKSFVYNDVIISFAETSISFENRTRHFVDFFDNLYDISPDKFNIRELPSYLVYMLWGSDRYEFLDDGCDFLISGFSPKGKPHVYLVKGKLGEIINLSRFQDFGCIGITSLANSILSDLITSELQT